jgi:hypothetical protein
LEAEAVEEATGLDVDVEIDEVRPLPVPAKPRDLSIMGGEVGTVAIAAAGGLVAGAATVVAVRAARSVAQPKRRSLRRRSKDGMPGILASRSFMVDVHLLDR